MPSHRNPRTTRSLALAIVLLACLALFPMGDAHDGYGGGFSGYVLQGEDYASPVTPAGCDPSGDLEHTRVVSDWAGTYAFLPSSGCGILWPQLAYAEGVRFTTAQVAVSGTNALRSATVHVVVDGVTVASGTVTMTDTTRWAIMEFSYSIPVPPGIRQTIVTYTTSTAWFNLDVEWLQVQPTGPLTECGDGFDNDGDGWTDHPADPGCTDEGDASESPNPACSDGVDNDGDGLIDHPSDSGCSSLRDTSEGATCDAAAPEVNVCLFPNDPRESIVTLRAYEVGEGPTHAASGHVQIHRFLLPGSVSANLPCIVLHVDGWTSNPCADAGGTYVRTIQDLHAEEGEPQLDVAGDVLSVCHGELTLTVFGIGVTSAPAYAAC